MPQPASDRPLRTIYDPPSVTNELGTLAAKVAVNIRQSLQLEDILKTSVTEVRKILNVDRAVIYKFNPDRSGEIIVEDVIQPWKSILGEEINDSCFEYNWHIPFTQGLALATDDVEEFHTEFCYLQLLQSLQVRANVVAPIIEDDYLWGLFIVHQCSDRRQWTIEEVRLLQQLGVQLGIALQQAELYKQVKKQNQELELANERLAIVLTREKDLSNLKSNFLSLTAHEFRTPMTTILSSTEILESFECSPEERNLLFKQIHNAVDYMVKMLDDIRFMSRRPEEALKLQGKSFNIISLIENTFDSLRSLLNSKHECNCQIKNVPETLFLDEKLMQQILENLLSNAMKYSSPENPILIHLDGKSNEGLWLEVCDRGIGIPEAEQIHVYETFYRAKNVAGMKGTGLGLAIVKKCVDLCGGTIDLKSKINEGTTVRVYLPFIETEI